MESLLSKINNSKLFISTAASAALMTVSTFAAETGGVDVTAIMGTAMEGAKSDMMGVIGVAVPIVAGIAATVLSIKFGLKFFKNTTGSTN